MESFFEAIFFSLFLKDPFDVILGLIKSADGELMIPNIDFQTSSGQIRSHDQSLDAILNVFDVPVIPGATSYTWTLPTGAYISAGMGTNEVTVGFDPQAITGDISVFGVNDCGDGTASTKQVIVSDCLGINNYTLEAAVKLFPNPVEEVLNIQINGSEKQILLTISDVTGNTKLTESLSNLPARYTKQIDVSGLAEGVYFVRLTSEERYFVEKFVVLR